MYTAAATLPIKVYPRSGVWRDISLKEWAFRKAWISDDPESVLEIPFETGAINLPILHHEWSGIVELRLNDGPPIIHDLYSPVFELVTIRFEPGEGSHRLTVRLTGGRNHQSKGSQVIVGEPSALPVHPHNAAVPMTDLVSLRSGDEGQFFVLSTDIGVSRTILDTGTWTPEDVALFRKLIRSGDHVLDIGANLGHHTVVFSRLVGPEGRVDAFEPQRLIYQVLCSNLLLNHCFNAYPHRLALGETAGRMHLPRVNYLKEKNFGATYLSFRYDNPLGETATIVPLDRFVEEEGLTRIDFLKVDVQTFELFVLRGAIETLRKFQPTVFVEIAPFWMKYLNNYDYRDIYRLLQDTGYQILDTQLNPVNLDSLPVPDEIAEADRNREWDVVAVHQDKPIPGR